MYVIGNAKESEIYIGLCLVCRFASLFENFEKHF